MKKRLFNEWLSFIYIPTWISGVFIKNHILSYIQQNDIRLLEFFNVSFLIPTIAHGWFVKIDTLTNIGVNDNYIKSHFKRILKMVVRVFYFFFLFSLIESVSRKIRWCVFVCLLFVQQHCQLSAIVSLESRLLVKNKWLWKKFILMWWCYLIRKVKWKT